MATYTISSGDVDDLIAKIILTNSTPDADIIELSEGTYDLNTYSGASGARTTTPFRTPGGALADINGLPVVTQPLTIRGLGSTPADTVLTRIGTTLYRLLYVVAGKQLTLENLTLSNGEPANLDYSGGGVYNKGSLIVTNCILGPNNKSNYGGAIRNDGTATINGCEIVGNTTGAGGNGGGIYSEGVSTTILNSVLRDNNGPNGGALLNSKATAVMTVQNCIIKDNTGIYGGGIACYAGSVAVSGCTIYGNHTNGGAFHTRGSGTQITAHENNLFDNGSGSSPAVEAWAGTTIDAQENWWGRPDGPAAGEVVGAVDVSEHKLNPVLSPKYLNCLVNLHVGAITRRGPSSDDLAVSQGAGQFPVRAKAIDEDEVTWYGFEHPDRLGVHSWIAAGDADSVACDAQLPDLSIVADDDYSTPLVMTWLPVNDLDSGREQHGYAWFDSNLYPLTNGWHTGFDFSHLQTLHYPSKMIMWTFWRRLPELW